MALGDGIRRNIASVDPSERALLRDALIALNQRLFPGSRTDPNAGGVSWWFKQDEIHQATHVHGRPEFVPWHRELVNRLEAMLRQIDPRLSLHYWDWTQDPRAIPNANLGGGATGTLNLFTPDFMGYGGSSSAPIGEPWLSAGYYVPGANPHRDATGNPADPPRTVVRFVSGSPASAAGDNAIANAVDYPTMWNLLAGVHNAMHGFVAMGSAHVSFRDPFVFLLHSNVDRLFARWQTDPARPERLDPNAVYGSESGDAGLNSNIRPWSGVPPTNRPWAPPENQQFAKNCKHPSVVSPPRYDTNFPGAQLVVANFAYNAGGWRVERHPRFLADLTGDRRADIVGFGNAGVWVALNNGTGTFQAPQMVVGNFG
ncbi:tyrosinase family protein, partial [Variovorax sp. WDL1]